MNISGIGIDTVEIARFEKMVKRLGKKFLEKIFTGKELKYAEKKKTKFIHLAGKFAAKESVKKCLPKDAQKGVAWPEIEILNTDDGRPYAVLHGRAKKNCKKYKIGEVFVSISHTSRTAVANAVVMKYGA